MAPGPEADLAGGAPTSSTKPGARAHRRTSRIALVACVLAALAALIHVDSERLADPDLFVNLYAGRDIVAHGGPLLVDTATFSLPGRPSMDYEWLARAGFYSVYKGLGGRGLVLLRLLLTAAVILILYLHGRRYSRSSVPFMIAMGFFASCAGRYFLCRTTLITFACVAGLLALIDRARDGRPGLLWVVPPLMVAWVNLHGGFALGVVLLGVVAAESVLIEGAARLAGRWGFGQLAASGTGAAEGLAGPPGAAARAATVGPQCEQEISVLGSARTTGEETAAYSQLGMDRSRALIPIRYAVAVFLASFAASGVNPYGYGNWLAVFRTMGGGFTPKISEWMPIYKYDFLPNAPVYLLMITVAASLIAARRRIYLFELMTVLGLGTATIFRTRFAPLFTIAALVVLMRVVPEVWSSTRTALTLWTCRILSSLGPGHRFRRSQPTGGSPLGVRMRPLRAALALAVPAVAGVALWIHEGQIDLYLRKDEWYTPVRGVKFLQENAITGRILNEYDWGGYIHFMLPDSSIFVDGRSDTVYPESLIRDWTRFVDAAGLDWSGLPERYRAQIIFIRSTNVVVPLLQRDSRWLYAYADLFSSIFIRDSAENALWVQRLKSRLTVTPTVTSEDYLVR